MGLNKFHMVHIEYIKWLLCCFVDKCKNSGWSGCPLGWTGPIPAKFWSFDTNDGTFTHHGSQLIAGKVIAYYYFKESQQNKSLILHVLYWSLLTGREDFLTSTLQYTPQKKKLLTCST